MRIYCRAQELYLMHCGGLNQKEIQKGRDICIHMCLVAQSCPTLCDPLDCSPPGSSVHGMFQARILEWVVMPSSRGSSQTRDQTQVSGIAGRFFTI